MKKYKKVLLFLLIFISIFLLDEAKAEALNTNKYTYEWEDDILIIGTNHIEKTFYIPQNMNVSNFNFSLKIRQSPTLVKEISSISVLVNDILVDSITMENLGSSNIFSIKVPAHLIKKGTNSIKIKGFLKSTYEKCEINNEINWVIIEKLSSFSFDQERVSSTDISHIFDNTYYSDGLYGQVNLIVPDKLIEANYSQIASLSSLIGFVHKNKETDISIKVSKYSELEDINKEGIVIGTVEQIKALNNNLLTEKQWGMAEKHGYIAIRKIGDKNHFIVITTADIDLQVFSKIVQHKSSLSQLKGKDYVLDENKIVKEGDFNSNPSLDTLGYGNSSQIGNGIKTFDYYFTIPANQKLTTNNKLTFAYNYSILKDEQESYITVEINGEPLASKELVAGKNQDKIEITIPEKYFEYAGFNISLKFNVAPSIENCTSKTYDNIWVNIDDINSNFKLELKDRTKYSLINSHGLLQNSNGRLDGTILVDKYENLTIDSICEISSYLGKVSQGVNQLLLYEGDSIEGSEGSVFALTSSPIIQDLKGSLRIPVSESGEFISQDLFIQNTSSLGVIEVMKNEDKFIITANDKAQLNNAIKKYSKIIIKEDTVILRDEEVIDTFEEEKIVIDKNVKNILEKIKSNYEVLLAAGVLLFATVLIFALYYYKGKK